MTIALKNSILYGPVASRRFGVSLGINLLPAHQKQCTFSCTYCQYADTPVDAKPEFPTLSQLHQELMHYFQSAYKERTHLDRITIAGNGEPTLHPHFPEAVSEILRLRDIYLNEVPVGILTNSSTCLSPRIREALLKLDARYMKLDSGNISGFSDVNRPHRAAVWGPMLDGLKNLPGIVIQSMFVTGVVDNTGDEDVKEWIDQVNDIRPESVQVYTVDRPAYVDGVRRVEVFKLYEIAQSLTKRTGIDCNVYE